MAWRCLACGRTCASHRCRLPGERRQDCVNPACGGPMEIVGSLKPKRKGPPKLKRKGPYPGRCPVCLGDECEDPICARARGEE